MKVNFTIMELAILEQILDTEIPSKDLCKSFNNPSEYLKAITRLCNIGIVRHFISSFGTTVKLTEYGKCLYLNGCEALYPVTNEIIDKLDSES